eukprot:30504-Chlamydomonas_euryale.AAC.5
MVGNECHIKSNGRLACHICWSCLDAAGKLAASLPKPCQHLMRMPAAVGSTTSKAARWLCARAVPVTCQLLCVLAGVCVLARMHCMCVPAACQLPCVPARPCEQLAMRWHCASCVLAVRHSDGHGTHLLAVRQLCASWVCVLASVCEPAPRAAACAAAAC